MDKRVGAKLGDLIIRRIEDDLGHKLYILQCACGSYLSLYDKELYKGNCGQCKANVRTYVKGRPEMMTDRYKNWRKKVFAKDGFKCTACGSKKSLRAHHKNAWNWDQQGRYRISNGATLCNSCHEHIHKMFGYNTNEAQYELFKRTKAGKII